ncbi:energy transducer TonB [Vibrio cortegadensis]|uniref:Protein TonB n=1 Tax=Vibrio cortegadensis TaxID=1328770 RepID=A0ABV4M8B4_9VIBR
MLRLLMALPFAVAISIGLFTFMAWMVDSGHQRTPDQAETLSFNMLMIEQEEALQRRKRSVPEQPKAPEMPPKSAMNQAKTEATVSNPKLSLPDLGLNTIANGLAINMPTFGDFGSNQKAMPLYRVEPRYPAKAKKRKVEGFVEMEFTIDKTGRPTDIKITSAKPARMFDRSARRALKKWKYQPKIVDGQSVEQLGQTVRIEFKMDK